MAEPGWFIDLDEDRGLFLTQEGSPKLDRGPGNRGRDSHNLAGRPQTPPSQQQRKGDTACLT